MAAHSFTTSTGLAILAFYVVTFGAPGAHMIYITIFSVEWAHFSHDPAPIWMKLEEAASENSILPLRKAALYESSEYLPNHGAISSRKTVL